MSENYFSFFESGLEGSVVPIGPQKKMITVCTDRLQDESVPEMLERQSATIKKYKAIPLMQWIFGGINPKNQKTDQDVQNFVDQASWPVIWIHGDGNKSTKVTATQVIALSAPKSQVSAHSINGITPMVSYEDDFGRYSYISVLPPHSPIGVDGQANSALYALNTLLDSNHMDFTSIARTWFYLDHLLQWYDSFNKVRTQFFDAVNLFDAVIPSSTGIGGANSKNRSTSLSALAMVPSGKELKFEAVPSPLQCPAHDYRSSFSRAHLVTHPYYRQLMISGTASIYQGGESAHVGDIDSQIELTMKVVEEIYQLQGFQWADTTRAIVYLKDIKYLKNYRKFLEKNNIPAFPSTCIQADVCRDELLFEIELDAMQPTLQKRK